MNYCPHDNYRHGPDRQYCGYCGHRCGAEYVHDGTPGGTTYWLDGVWNQYDTSQARLDTAPVV